MKAKSLKKLLVIEEICSWLQTFRPSNPGGSQEHISLITNSFFNDFAFILQFQHKGYFNSWLYFISFSFTTGHFCMCVTVMWYKRIIFHFNSGLSFQRLCRLLQG